MLKVAQNIDQGEKYERIVPHSVGYLLKIIKLFTVTLFLETNNNLIFCVLITLKGDIFNKISSKYFR